jgi:hypothetical protein
MGPLMACVQGEAAAAGDFTGFAVTLMVRACISVRLYMYLHPSRHSLRLSLCRRTRGPDPASIVTPATPPDWR